MPTPMKITGRSSSITNAFINSIIPIIYPSNEELLEALSILEIEPTNLKCSYCGSTSTEWDHLRPLVMNKKPTGYISELCNLVPSCGKCNQSKGNKNWKVWMLSSAKLSPKTKGTKDLEERIRKLEAYENWKKPVIIDFEKIIGKETWQTHWQNCEKVQSLMKESQVLAESINKKIKENYKALYQAPQRRPPF